MIIPKEEQQENDAAFLDIMQQRFLAGRDAGVDYAAIDAGGAAGWRRWALPLAAAAGWDFAMGGSCPCTRFAPVGPCCAPSCPPSCRHLPADAELDEDWAEQAGRDAEDKYFDD